MPNWQYFKDDFSLDEYTTAADTSLTDDTFRTIERLELEEGEAHRLGQGQDATLTDAVGRIFADIQNGGGTTLSGKIRIRVENRQNNVMQNGVLYQNSISTLNKSAGDESGQTPFPYIDADVKYPYKVAIAVQLNSGTDSYDASNSTVTYKGYRGEEMS